MFASQQQYGHGNKLLPCWNCCLWHWQGTCVRKGTLNQQGWCGHTGDKVPAVPKQGHCEGSSPMSQQQLQPSWPPASPWFSAGSPPCVYEPSSLSLRTLCSHPPLHSDFRHCYQHCWASLTRAACTAQTSSTIRALGVTRLPFLPSSCRHLGNTCSLPKRQMFPSADDHW